MSGQYRDETGYDGALDTVSHSMGTCITRYWLEVMDGKEHEEHVRQLDRARAAQQRVCSRKTVP